VKLRLGGAMLAALALTACATTPPPVRPPAPPPIPAPPSEPRPAPAPEAPRILPLTALPGWSEEDHAGAFTALTVACGASRDPAMRRICTDARAVSGPGAARAFLENRFVAEAVAGSGVLTGYYAPVYPARATPDGEFNAPVRPKPADLRSVDAGLFDPAQAGRPGAAFDAGTGDLLPYPDRAAIEAAPAAEALAWMKPEDLFFLQVQGSGTLVFQDGRRMKALYAANNGRPFVALAEPMRERGLLPPEGVSAAAIHGWLADHRGPEAQALMQLNPRYAFFRLAPDDRLPPVGAANIPLPAGRAAAIDPSFHLMGDLLWLDAEAPILTGAFPRYSRFVAALDTGGAIRGPVRADLYVGEGEAAGVEAGRIRHTLRLWRLVPKDLLP
jgi:membrane-bound lytic murein transglycosylase A